MTSPAATSQDSLAERPAFDVSPQAVIVLGKELRLRPDQARRELAARTAAAAILHHRFGIRVLTVEGELSGAAEAGSQVVRRLLAELGVPSDQIVARSTSHATLVEVMTTRVCMRAMDARRAIAVTSGYHVRRAQHYFDAARRERDATVAVMAPESIVQRYASTRDELEREEIKRAADTIGRSGLTARELAIELRTERILRAGARLLSILPRRLAWAIELTIAGQLRGTPADLQRLIRIARRIERPARSHGRAELAGGASHDR